MTRARLYFGVFPVCLLLTLSAALTEGALRVPPSWRTEPATAQADAVARDTGATWREVEVTAADGVRLRGWLFEPPKPSGDAVIALHGHVDTRKGVLSHAAMLLRHGYAVLTPDSRGHGASGGDLITFGIAESQDAGVWAAWLQANTGARRVYGLGESMGAAVLLQTGSLLRAIAAEGSYSSFRKVAYDRMTQRFGLPGRASGLFALLVEPGLLYSRLRYGVDLAAVSPAGSLRQSTTPVLLIHGAADSNIPPDHADDLAAARPGIVVWKPAATGHVAAISTHPAEFESRVIAWFAAHR